MNEFDSIWTDETTSTLCTKCGKIVYADGYGGWCGDCCQKEKEQSLISEEIRLKKEGRENCIDEDMKKSARFSRVKLLKKKYQKYFITRKV